GWCAGRPADHGVENETEVAKLQLAAYPGTTGVREFRTGMPSTAWWSQQTLGALANHAVRPRQFDVALSWTTVNGAPLRATLEAAPSWVDRIILLGVHEMHNPSKGYTPDKFAADMRWVRAEIPERLRSRVIVAPCFIYYRSRISAPSETAAYLTPLMDERLIDAVTWDIYPSNPADVGNPGGATNPPEYEPAASLLQHARDWMDETGLPYGIMEFNYGRRANDPDGRKRAALYGDVFRLARADGAISLLDFHYSGGDMLARGEVPEMDQWAALCRESEAARLAYEVGYSDAQLASAGSYENGRRDAYADVALYAQTKING
ncbi:MAG TPA: hypothetical protein VFP10_12325, partial [Candidatus Eisenbacteria bacterium]|nr:hypothetical protein [Candidatus Eisenbacteria bacterium]